MNKVTPFRTKEQIELDSLKREIGSLREELESLSESLTELTRLMYTVREVMGV